MVDLVTQGIAIGTLVMHILLLVGVVLVVLKKGSSIFTWIGARGMLFAYVLSLVAMIGSLFYSEIAQFAPCVLCWWQRIFIYANAFILGLAVYRKDTAVLPYAILLAVCAAVIGLYQVGLATLTTIPVTCSITSDVSCTVTYVQAFGYITIPIMAVTTSVVTVVLLYLAQRYVSRK